MPQPQILSCPPADFLSCTLKRSQCRLGTSVPRFYVRNVGSGGWSTFVAVAVADVVVFAFVADAAEVAGVSEVSEVAEVRIEVEGCSVTVLRVAHAWASLKPAGTATMTTLSGWEEKRKDVHTSGMTHACTRVSFRPCLSLSLSLSRSLPLSLSPSLSLSCFGLRAARSTTSPSSSPHSGNAGFTATTQSQGKGVLTMHRNERRSSTRAHPPERGVGWRWAVRPLGSTHRENKRHLALVQTV
jgi:hypothetical protein